MKLGHSESCSSMQSKQNETNRNGMEQNDRAAKNGKRIEQFPRTTIVNVFFWYIAEASQGNEYAAHSNKSPI